MKALLKRYLPEPVQKPLRGLRDRVKNCVIEHCCRTEIGVERVNRIFHWNRYWYVATYADNQIITRHNCDFLQNGSFSKAYASATEFTGESRAPWSIYLLQWVARRAAKVGGDFVECGTARGFAAATILASVDLPARGKRLFLFDSWSGVLPGQLTEAERALYGPRLDSFIRDYSGHYTAVKDAFAPFPHVTLVRGYVPDALAQVEIPTVCFLHIDMNAVYPEVQALRFFWPRLARGAWVILDDYGQPGRREQKRGMDRLAAELGFDIFASPTGQGVIVKD
jgi:hypothetical protein